jgi:hypothetical protein
LKAARSLAIIQALIEYPARTVHRSHSLLTLFVLIILRLALRPTCVFRLSILRRRLRSLTILCGRWNNQGQDKRERQRQCSDHDGLPHRVDRTLRLMRTRCSERHSRQAHRLGVQASAGSSRRGERFAFLDDIGDRENRGLSPLLPLCGTSGGTWNPSPALKVCVPRPSTQSSNAPSMT